MFKTRNCIRPSRCALISLEARRTAFHIYGEDALNARTNLSKAPRERSSELFSYCEVFFFFFFFHPSSRLRFTLLLYPAATLNFAYAEKEVAFRRRRIGKKAPTSVEEYWGISYLHGHFTPRKNSRAFPLSTPRQPSHLQLLPTMMEHFLVSPAALFPLVWATGTCFHAFYH